MRKLFHEAAVQPEAVLRNDAKQLLQELRFDRSRYVEGIPDDWFAKAYQVLKSSSDPNMYRIKAFLDKLRPSIIRLRAYRESGGTGNRTWLEAITLADKVRPFDLVVSEAELFSGGQAEDLDDYLVRSNAELGVVHETFRRPEDWYEVIKPLIYSDNVLAIVDPYFDPSKDYYADLLGPFLGWIEQSRIRELRLFIGPKKNSYERADPLPKRLDAVVNAVTRLAQKHCARSPIRIVVFYCLDIHRRYLATKECGIDLDYGFRLSTESKRYKCLLLRRADIDAVRLEFLSAASGGAIRCVKTAVVPWLLTPTEN